MYHLIKQPEEQLRILFRNTAQKTGLHEAIVEKDFWVCLTLDYLFHYCPWKEAFTFKGGTSLSKCYGLIKRFSEDIDLILDWRVLGYGLNEPSLYLPKLVKKILILPIFACPFLLRYFIIEKWEEFYNLPLKP